MSAAEKSPQGAPSVAAVAGTVPPLRPVFEPFEWIGNDRHE